MNFNIAILGTNWNVLLLMLDEVFTENTLPWTVVQTQIFSWIFSTRIGGFDTFINE